MKPNTTLNIITENTFTEKFFHEREMVGIVFFYDPRNPESKMMKPVVAKIFAKKAGVFDGCSVNVRRNKWLKNFCNVAELPTFVIVRKDASQEIVVTGLHTEDELERLITEAINKKA
jgi:thioredoxin-like negative regulator of GroEL